MEILENALSHKIFFLKILNLSLYPHPHQKLIGYILGRNPSSIQVSWISIQ